MAFCQIVFSILVLSVVNSYAKSSVPVLIWGDISDISQNTNPLSSLKAEDLNEKLRALRVEDPLVVVFLEENLSVEDFAQRTAVGETSFPYLQSNLDDTIYLPSVLNPVEVLNKLGQPEEITRVQLTDNQLPSEIDLKGEKFIFITFNDVKVGESRADMLRRHNDFMETMFEKLQSNNDKVLAIYTAENPSWVVPVTHSRVRRDARVEEHVYSFSNLLLDISNVTIQVDNSISTLSNLIGNSTSLTSTELSVTLNYENNGLTLKFTNDSMGYWKFETVTLTQNAPESFSEELQPISEVYALNGFAYRCAEGVVFASVNASRKANVTFSDLMVQPFFQENTNSSQLEFGDYFNCVGFFSAPIWSGLFVTFILLLITFYGIMMMMDIRTMDRFDDPKGKTITINAGE